MLLNSLSFIVSGNHRHQNSLDFSSEGWPVKLKDKHNDKRSIAHSLVGTPNYIAPEILLQEGML